MVDYTAPVTTTFELQRQTIEQGTEAFHRTAGMPQRMSNAMVDGIESSESGQRQRVKLQHDAIH